MDSDKLIPSPDVVNSSGNGEPDNMSSPAKHKSNYIGNAVDQPDIDILINGLSTDPGNQEQHQVVTPEMLYKLSKKIAQLTKVF